MDCRVPHTIYEYIDVVLFILKSYFRVDVAKNEDEYNKILVWNNSDNDRLYSELLKCKEELRRKLEGGEHISLEDIFTIFDKAIDFRNQLNGFDYSKISIIKNSLMLLFIYYFNDENNKHNFKTKDYLDVITYIKSSNNDISIITTNWDCIFENYLEKNDLNINYCFNKSYYKIFGDKHKQDKDIKEIPFIKIHGSVNWFSCISCGTLIIFNDQKKADCIFDDSLMKTCEKCSCTSDRSSLNQLEPKLFTPTMFKELSSQLFSNVWKFAYDELLEAKKIIFLGYSFPLSDFEFRYLIKRSIQRNIEIDVVLWETDNPKKYLMNIIILIKCCLNKGLEIFFLVITLIFIILGLEIISP
ncbi:SIR2 family protein [Spiroplasma endosymbiont of Nebria brevicollis]|uniref:SIR2 family protein n=1 Tax=Spiroplasma endosymbiont of Nebria brevicollis TaxID=3066284 RepID=UPI00313AF539